MGRSEPEWLVVLTLDDGCADTCTTAYPILEERGLPFAIYLTTKPNETVVPLGPPN